jgi:hypothetical protein
MTHPDTIFPPLNERMAILPEKVTVFWSLL